ncbi:hypothetical protein CFOL_v3_02412, partial [Cephalotus follicularis]
ESNVDVEDTSLAKDNVEPIIGKPFATSDDAYTFYNSYAYLRDIFFVGMTTSGRSDSIHSFFDGYVNASTTFWNDNQNCARKELDMGKKSFLISIATCPRESELGMWPSALILERIMPNNGMAPF